MLKRNLRIMKRTKNIPVRGVCESCNMEFFADPRNLGQAAIQQQFNAHKCKALNGNATSDNPASDSPAPVARPAKKNK